MVRLRSDPVQSTSSGKAIGSISVTSCSSENMGTISSVGSSPSIIAYIVERIIEISSRNYLCLVN